MSPNAWLLWRPPASPSAFQGTNTFPSDQPVLVLALAPGLRVPLRQGAPWWVVTLEDAVQLKPLLSRQEGRVLSSHSLSQSKLYRLERLSLPRRDELLS